MLRCCGKSRQTVSWQNGLYIIQLTIDIQLTDYTNLFHLTFLENHFWRKVFHTWTIQHYFIISLLDVFPIGQYCAGWVLINDLRVEFIMLGPKSSRTVLYTINFLTFKVFNNLRFLCEYVRLLYLLLYGFFESMCWGCGYNFLSNLSFWLLVGQQLNRINTHTNKSKIK